MVEEYTKKISILTYQAEKEPESMFLSPTRMIAKYSDLGYEKLKESLSDFVNRLADIVETLPKSHGDYEVDNLTFSLSINGSGKISLIGELSAGVTSGITITFNKKR